jgi:PTH1 family peptidyl-tRNA hydrolase
MNLSGLAVRELVGRCEVDLATDPAGLIVVYDEAALPWGMLRIRERGSAGGHNGVKSIIGALGTHEFARIRLGVQPDPAGEDLAGYLLAPMRKAQLEVAAEMVEKAAEAVDVILTDGLARAMNRFNKRVPPPGEGVEQNS